MSTELENDIVYKSYGRCIIKKGFFEDFYAKFLESSPAIKPMFAKTDMARQRQLLQNGISYMIMFAKNSPIGIAKLEKIAELHDRNHVNVKPELYQFWLDSLLAVVRAYDTAFSPETESAWITTMNKGLTYFKSLY